MNNSRNKKRLSIRKLAIPIVLIVFIFSIFKVGKTLASTDSFKITDVQLSSKSSTAEVKKLTYEKCKVTKDIEFHKVGDSITYSIKVKNNDDKNYVIKSVRDDSKNSYISYEYSSYEGTKLNAGEETTFEITEKYSQENLGMSKRNQSFTVNFTFTLEDESGKTVEKSIAVNPQTGDNVGPYAATAIASLILLIILSRKRKVVKVSKRNSTKNTRIAKSNILESNASSVRSTRNVQRSKTTRNAKKGKHSGKGFKFFSLILAIAIIFPTISKAADNNSLVITFENNIYLKDKLVVQYEADGKIKEKVVKYNELIGEIEEPTKDGYEFEEWVLEDGTPFNPENPITDDTKITAKFKTVTYTISYDLKDGSLEEGKTNPEEYTVESEDIVLNKPTKEAYVFSGWTGTELNGIVENVTIAKGSKGNREYTANWTTSDYTITYNLNGGTATGNPDTYTIESDDINLNKPTKFGYTFTGWTGTELTDKTEEVLIAKGSKGNREYTANWQANTYSVIFDRNTGSGSMANQAMTYDVEANLNTNEFTKTGYTFAGWNTKADGQGTHYRDGDAVSNLASEQGAEVTLYAEWTPNTYTIVFNKNDDAATGTMANQTITYDTAANLTPNAFEKTNYKFVRWNTQADGQGVIYRDGQEVLNLTAEDGATINLYAEWKELTSTLRTGASINAILREINEDATTFTRYTGTPDFDNIDGERDIALATSNFPVWTWADGDTIYWWSEAEKPNMNSNSAEMFNSTKFTSVDLSGFNTTTATTLRSMFTRSYAENINFGDGDFTNVSDMSGMFEATKVTTLDLSGIKTSTTLNTVSRMFAESSNLTNITFSEDFDTSGVTLFSEMFRGAGSLANIDGVEEFDTSSAIKMDGMFWNNKVTSLDLTGWNVSNVTTIEHLFRGCSKLETLDVSNWNVSNVTNMSDVFGTPVLNTLDLSHWTNSKVKTMDYMFQGGKYTELDLSGIDTSNVTNMEYMFNETGKIETVYVSENFVVNTNQAMFINNKAMVGGAGTANPGGGAWRTSYGCIDDPDNGKPGYFTLKNARYIRYNGNGADNAEPYGTMTSHYLTNTGSLKANAYTRDGYTFVGWNTEADGSGTSYTNKQLMSDIVESKTPLTLYAQWEKNKTKLYDVANVGDYVEYKPTTASYTPNSNSNVTGTIYPNTTTSWRVLSKNSDGTIDLISTNTVGTLTFGKSGYGVENNTYADLDNTFEGISNSFINSNYAGSVRIPSQSDFNTIKNNGLASSQNYILNKKDYESRSTTGDHEGGATWDYYIYYANGSTMEKFRIWYKYAGTGGQSSTGYSTTLGIRPIVRLKADLYTNDGNGTSGNSYNIIK